MPGKNEMGQKWSISGSLFRHPLNGATSMVSRQIAPRLSKPQKLNYDMAMFQFDAWFQGWMLVTIEFHEGPSVRSTLAIRKQGEKYKTKAMQKQTWTQKKLHENTTTRHNTLWIRAKRNEWKTWRKWNETNTRRNQNGWKWDVKKRRAKMEQNKKETKWKNYLNETQQIKTWMTSQRQSGKQKMDGRKTE